MRRATFWARVLGAGAGCVLPLSALAQSTSQYLYLGRATDMTLTQPTTAWELRDPTTNARVSPDLWVTAYLPAVLDTGANGVVLASGAYVFGDSYQVQTRADGSTVQYMETGAAGVDLFDLMVPYHMGIVSPANIDPFGNDPPMDFTVPNVRVMAKSDLELGLYSAVAGMPVMIGRGVNMDFTGISQLGDMSTDFTTPRPANAPNVYRINLGRLPAQHSPPIEPGDPAPTFADLPLVQNFQVVNGGKSSTNTVLLDTGSMMSMISTATAQQLGLKLDEADPDTSVFDHIDIGGIGGTVSVPLVMLDRLVIPTANGVDLVMSDVIVGVTDIDGIDGVFGMNMLTAGHVEGVVDPWTGEVLSEGQRGYFDSAYLDFTGDQFELSLTVRSDANTPTEGPVVQPRRTKWWTGAFSDRWNDTSTNNFNDETDLSKYTDGDDVVFDDTLTGSRIITIAQPVAPGSVLVNNSSGAYESHGEAITGAGGLSKQGTSDLIVYTANSYTGSTEIVGGRVVFAAHQHIGPVNVYAGASALMQTSQHFQALNIKAGGSAAMDKNGTLLLAADELNIEAGGTFDLANNAAVVHATAANRDQVLQQIEGYVRSARNQATIWTGTGLTSSVAQADTTGLSGIGVILNMDSQGRPIFSTFQGEPVDTNSVLVKYTWNGDADLNGIVDGSDYFQIDKAYLLRNDPDPSKVLHGWYNGDFNYDDTIDGSDYFLIDKAFLSHRVLIQDPPTALSAMGLAVVPEPGGVVLLVIAGAMLRRRRK